jgi:hypothetical protein
MPIILRGFPAATTADPDPEVGEVLPAVVVLSLLALLVLLPQPATANVPHKMPTTAIWPRRRLPGFKAFMLSPIFEAL